MDGERGRGGKVKEVTHLGAISPRRRAEAEAVAHGVDKDEGDADGVRGLVDVVGIRQR